MKFEHMPKMGPLQGVRVAFVGISIAGPFACEIMAEWGADVIWLENPKAPDIARGGFATSGDTERRNMRTLAIDFRKGEGLEAFKRLLKETDIFLEATKGGNFAKMGFTDEWFWSINPKLVIVHLSGFGQTGLDEWITRGSYDPVAQAFSGMMNLQGYPGDEYPPQPAHLSACDYLSALHAATGALAALCKAQETGIGDSVDVAQYEAALRCQAQRPGEYYNLGVKPFREGYRHKTAACWGLFECMDKKYLYIIGLGVSQVKILCKLLGFEYGVGDLPEGTFYINRYETETGKLFQEKWLEYCATHNAKDIENTLLPAGVTCCKVNDYEDLLEDDLFLEHGALETFYTADGREYIGPCITPRFKEHPAFIWRGMPGVGQDNNDILEELGYSRAEIKELYEKKTINKKPIAQLTPELKKAIIAYCGWSGDQLVGEKKIDIL